MKKIGLWMAALTAVTVGGVYATFNYSDSSKMNSSMSDTAIGVADAKLEGAAGVLSVDAKGLIVMVDSAKSVLGDKLGETDAHKAMLQYSGSVVVRFTPNEGLQESDILNNGIHAKIYFTGSWGDVANWTYKWENKDIQIFSALNKNEIEIHQCDEESANTWKKENDGTFTFTITADQLFGDSNPTPLLVMNDIVLETYDEYEKFDASFSSKNLEARVEAVSDKD